MTPEQIETQSFQIIEKEAGFHHFPPDQWAIVRRMIHTSADFDYLTNVRFHPDAVAAGIGAIQGGKPIVTDTQMLASGIRKTALASFGCSLQCRIADPDVIRMAQANGTTRAHQAVDAVASEIAGGIYAVGNAPTALLRLIELIRTGQAKPALVIGLPVGFVNAAESKQELLHVPVPYITSLGRKGGSNVAAAVINALIILAAS